MSASFVQKATKKKRKEKKDFQFSNNNAKVQPEGEKKRRVRSSRSSTIASICMPYFSTCKILIQAQTASK